MCSGIGPRFRQESSFATWLYRLAYNVCADHWQKEKRGRELDEPPRVVEPAPSLDERHVVAR